eukprot:gene17926-19708_t
MHVEGQQPDFKVALKSEGRSGFPSIRVYPLNLCKISYNSNNQLLCTPQMLTEAFCASSGRQTVFFKAKVNIYLSSTVKARNRDPHIILKAKENVQIGSSVHEKCVEEENKLLKEELQAMKESHKEEIERLKNEIEDLKQENQRLRLQAKFSVETIKDNYKKFQFYTGLPNYQVFKMLFDSFGPAVHKLIYYDSNTRAENVKEDTCKRGPKRSTTAEEELFIVLVRLRCGILEEDIAYSNIPPFLRDHSSLTIEEETITRRIAAVRVHVEHAIRRVKVFRILKTIFPIKMAADLNKIWIVCVYLTNFLPPLIKE